MVKSLLRHVCVTLLAFAVVGLLVLAAVNVSLLSPVEQALREFSMTDVYYHVLHDGGRRDTSRLVTIVDMTELHDRRALAGALQQVAEAGPKVVGVDVVFEWLRTDNAADAMVARVATEHENMVLAYRLHDYIDEATGYAECVRSFFADSLRPGREGFTNFERNLYGGMKRTLTLQARCQGRPVTSLVSRVARGYAGSEVSEAEAELTISFLPTVFPVVKPESISQCRELLRDRIVLFGAMNELDDMHYTPLGRMAGVELLAYSVQTLVGQQEARRLPVWATVLLSVLLVMLTSWGLSAYTGKARRCRNRMAGFLMQSTFAVGLLLLLWMALLLWGGFLLFYYWRVSIDLGWALAAMPFLSGAREFLDLLKIEN